MIGPGRVAVALAALLLAAAAAGAQPASRPRPDGATAALSPDHPLRCWWRSSTGAIRVGEILEVTLTCVALETAEVRAVPDESRLSIASVQLMPFEIVGGSHPPDVRQGDRRLFQYLYQLRLLDPDAIGRDVKLPPLAIPYRVQSGASTAAAQAGRDLVHLMPQLVIRVVAQVPADAEDIRDGADASLARIDALRFRANAFRAATVVLGALGLVAALSALAPLVRRWRRGRLRGPGRVSDRLVLSHAAGVLDQVARAATAGWTPTTLAEAHAAARLVAAAVLRDGLRQRRLDSQGPPPEGRLVFQRRLRRGGSALTAHVTSASVERSLAALPPDVGATARGRLERLRDSLAALTRAQYVQDANLEDRAAIDEAVTGARDVAREVARERRWSPRDWFGAATPAAPAPGS